MSSGCPAITYPSGVVLETKPDAALSAQYAALGIGSCTTPKCFLDATDLRSPDGTKHDVNVKLADHFTFYEYVATEIDPKGTGSPDPANGYSMRVLVDASMMSHLEKLRIAYGAPVLITSGFRSPPHQKAICNSICG